MFRLIVAAELVVLIVLGAVWMLSDDPQATATETGLAAAAETDEQLVLIPPEEPEPTERGGWMPSTGESGARSRASNHADSTDPLLHDRPLERLDRPRVLVEKGKLRLTVFEDDRPVKRYVAAVGEAPGDKNLEGDMRTPEGTFYVCIRKNGRQTPYHRSIGLSYPNIEDAERGLRDGLISQREYDRIAYAIRNKQRPPWNTALGGAIMIHGKRDGRTGTQGCIAVDDAESEELFKVLPLGTPVQIVP